MSDLRFEPVTPDGDDAVLLDWQRVHNLIIPSHLLSVDEIRTRARRNRLHVAYREGVVVGCSTVRPPADDPQTATVIVRVLPEHRGQGFGEQMYDHALALAYELGGRVIETVVLAANEDGLRFAERHGFVEVDRYLLDGDTVPYVDLRLSPTK